jgi:hypothetical protein
MNRRARFLLPSVLALLTVSCFEQPVTESMEIRFLPGTAVMVRVTVQLADPELFENSPPARKRVEEARQDLLEGRDPWTKRLASLEPELQRTILDRKEGGLCRVEHRVVFEDAGNLKRFFSDTMIQPTLIQREEESELALVPGAGSRATRAQQERLKREMERWSADVSGYLEAGKRLYGYLDHHPDRARACFGHVLGDVLSPASKENLESLSTEDSKVVEPFKKGMEQVLGLFSVPEDSPESPEELSRLVFDPFPAPLVVRIPGPVLEVEGFEAGAPGVWRVPELSLWEALSALRDRWISPDPLILYFRQMRDGSRSLDLEEIVSLPRSAASPPGGGEILRSLAERLKPAPVYRVRWSTRGLADMEDTKGDLWDNPALK